MTSRRRNIIGVQIGAGLGNQMFMYAAGLALSRKLDAELLCDTYAWRKRGNRAIGLGEFGLQWKECLSPRANGLIRAAGRRLGLNPFVDHYYLCPEGHFDPAFRDLGAPHYLTGYFQSWRYFAGYEQAVSDAFKLPPPSTAAARATEAQIVSSTCPVAVHVRRGDYVPAPGQQAAFRVLDGGYYGAARTLIERAAGPSEFFVFSDDTSEASQLLAGWPNATFVSGNSTHDDLRLMSLCRHFIIANSTFSWWAAWLGSAAGKHVVAPNVWYAATYQHRFEIRDLLPATWIGISA